MSKLITITLALAFALSARAQVVVEAVGTTDSAGGASSLSLSSFNVPSGTTYLVAAVMHGDSVGISSVSIPGCTAAALTDLASNGGTRNARIYGCAAPSTGTQTITVNWTSSDFSNQRLSVYALSSVHATTPTADGTTTTGSSNAPSITVSNVASTDLVIDAVFHAAICSPGSNQTANGNNNRGKSSYQSGANGGTMSWTGCDESLTWAAAAVRIQAAAGGGGSAVPVILQQMGDAANEDLFDQGHELLAEVAR